MLTRGQLIALGLFGVFFIASATGVAFGIPFPLAASMSPTVDAIMLGVVGALLVLMSALELRGQAQSRVAAQQAQI